MDPIPLPGLPCLASVGEDVPSLAVTLCAKGGWYQVVSFPFSEEKDKEEWKEGLFQRQSGSSDQDVK